MKPFLQISSISELGKVLFEILPNGRAPPRVEKTRILIKFAGARAQSVPILSSGALCPQGCLWRRQSWRLEFFLPNGFRLLNRFQRSKFLSHWLPGDEAANKKRDIRCLQVMEHLTITWGSKLFHKKSYSIQNYILTTDHILSIFISYFHQHA